MSRVTSLATVALLLVVSACAATEGAGSTDDGDGATTTPPEETRVQVVVTTSILGDIVGQVLAPAAATDIEVLLPPGADPHGYAPSAADALALREADVVYAIGLGLEEALDDALAAAEEDGVRVVELGELVDPLPYDDRLSDLHGDHEDHAGEDDHDHDDEHADEGEHADEDEHAGEKDGDEGHAHEGGLDPHVWLDPLRAAQLGQEVAAVHAEVAPADAEAVQAAADALTERLTALDAELAELVATIPADRRQLVTNHEALGYLAARYDLDVIATVLPGTSADVDVTAGAFTELVQLLRDTGVPAVFAETTSSDRLAQALASEVEGVRVVELYTDSLGEPGSGADSIEGMLRVDVERIVDALG